jgi:hypothetical protein
MNVSSPLSSLFLLDNMMCTDDQDIAAPCPECLLEEALTNPSQRRQMLQQPELLQQIMKNIEARTWLFRQACQETDLNRKQKARLMIMEMMQASGSIWRGGSGVDEDDYDEALVRTLDWFGRRLQDYDPAIASFTTWFNNYLRWRIIDVMKERIDRERNELHLAQWGDEDQPKDVGDLASPPPPEQSFLTLEELKNLAQLDLQMLLQRKRMQQHLHVNGQKLVLAVLKSVETTSAIDWEVLATQFEVTEPRLRNFYRTIQPIFRKMCQDNLDS